MTKKEIDAAVLAYINANNQLRFKSGGIALPIFKSLEEMHKFNEIMEKTFKPANKEYLATDPKPKIAFNIDPKYLKEQKP